MIMAATETHCADILVGEPFTRSGNHGEPAVARQTEMPGIEALAFELTLVEQLARLDFDPRHAGTQGRIERTTAIGYEQDFAVLDQMAVVRILAEGWKLTEVLERGGVAHTDDATLF